MSDITIDSTFSIGDKVIDALTVGSMKFVAYTELVDKAVARAPKNAKGPKLLSLIQRERIKAQASFMCGSERVIPDDAAIMQLPIPVARKILAALDDDQGAPGEIISDGDGIATPLLYKLGTPIPLSGAKSAFIGELEFLAKTYGDIEDILATGDNNMAQGVEFIARLGKPADIESLQTLPSWAVSQITMSDGIMITRDVLPRFLG